MGLKERREASGLTQQAAADLFGIKYRTYQNYENGVTTPTMETAARFARHFDCTIGELFDLTEGSKERMADDEAELLKVFRNLGADGRRLLLGIAKEIEKCLCD